MKSLFLIALTLNFSNLLFAQEYSSIFNEPESFIPKSVKSTVVSWNIQMLPNGLGIFSKSLRKKQNVRVPWIINHCIEQNYDVIVFQEVFDSGIKRKLKRQLKPRYPYQVDTRTKFGRLSSNGILIVGRIPIKYVNHVIFKRGVHQDGWAAKGCTLVELEKDGVKFHIAATHLQSGDSEAAVMHRFLQYQEIHHLLDTNISDGIPVLVVGDMNTPKSNKMAFDKMLEVLGVQDFPIDEIRPYTIDENNYWNIGTENMQLDYILLRRNKTTTRIINQTILRPRHEYKGIQMDFADHYGIIAEIEISN